MFSLVNLAIALCKISSSSCISIIFNGLAQVIIQSKANEIRPLILTAIAHGLEPATLKISYKKVEAIAAVPASNRHLNF